MLDNGGIPDNISFDGLGPKMPKHQPSYYQEREGEDAILHNKPIDMTHFPPISPELTLSIKEIENG